MFLELVTLPRGLKNLLMQAQEKLIQHLNRMNIFQQKEANKKNSWDMLTPGWRLTCGFRGSTANSNIINM